MGTPASSGKGTGVTRLRTDRILQPLEGQEGTPRTIVRAIMTSLRTVLVLSYVRAGVTPTRVRNWAIIGALVTAAIYAVIAARA